MKQVFVYLVVCLFINTSCRAQTTLPFYQEVHAFSKLDSTAFPEANQILFIGSSSFTMWRDVQNYFPEYKILNRAFGGSSLPDLIRYRYEILYPYAPKQIVIYCGENDFTASDTLSVKTVMDRFETFFGLLRSKYPTTPVLYVSMKPSPSRAHLVPKYKAANEVIKTFLYAQANTGFVDVFSAMLKADGKPKSEIFLSDSLHMNANGYAIWQKLLAPHLIK